MKDQEPVNESPHINIHSETALLEPHFDEMAVAIAQPVQLLPDRPPRRSFHLSTVVLLLILVAMVGGSATAFGLNQLFPHMNSAEEAVLTQPEEPATAETVGTSDVQDQKDVARRPSRRSRPREVAPEGKPVARKVGEIVYRN
jgi:hypothetical protein